MGIVGIDKTVGRIKELCKARGVKQSFLIEELGLNNSYFGDLVRRNGNISDDRLLKIAELLNTSVEYLRGETDNPDLTDKKELDALIAQLPDSFMDVIGELAQKPNGDLYIDALLTKAKQMLEEENQHQENLKKILGT